MNILTPIPTPNPHRNTLRFVLLASSLQLFDELCKFIKAFVSSSRICSELSQSVCKVASCASSFSYFFCEARICCCKLSFKRCKVSILRAASARSLGVSSERQSKGKAAEGCKQKATSIQAAPSLLVHIGFP